MAAKFISNFVGGTSRSNWARMGLGYTQNMYLETTDAKDHFFARVLLPMPGQKSLFSVTGSARGMFTATGGFYGDTVYFVAGNDLYCIAEGAPLKIGQVGTGRIDFDELRTADKNFLLVSDGSSLFAVDMTENPSMQKMQQIPLPKRVNDDGTFSENIRPTSVCVCYSMINVVDEGTDKFYTSVTLPLKMTNGVVDFDAFAVRERPGTTDGSERPYYEIGYYTFAETKADVIMRLVTNGTDLFAIGRSSFDRFTYTGVAISKSIAAGVVWKCPRGQGGFYGTDDPESVQVLGGSVYYLARNPAGGKSIVRLGSTIESISTPEIEHGLTDPISSTCFQWGQHPFYVLKMLESTLAYDVREGAWLNLTWDVESCVSIDSEVYIQYDGGVGSLTSDKWTDHSGYSIIRKRAGVITNPNYDELELNQVSVITNAGQYREAGKEYRATFRWSTDGVTWEDTGIETLGKAGQYDRILDVYDLGVGRTFNIEISCSEDIPFCIYGIRVEAAVCDL